jgi:hypothetical protein
MKFWFLFLTVIPLIASDNIIPLDTLLQQIDNTQSFKEVNSIKNSSLSLGVTPKDSNKKALQVQKLVKEQESTIIKPEINFSEMADLPPKLPGYKKKVNKTNILKEGKAIKIGASTNNAVIKKNIKPKSLIVKEKKVTDQYVIKDKKSTNNKVVKKNIKPKALIVKEKKTTDKYINMFPILEKKRPSKKHKYHIREIKIN